MPELILSLDIGTTSVSACLFEAGGALRGLATTPVASRSDRPGQVEQDAAALWASAQQVIGEALNRAGVTGADLAAVGVTSQRASIVVWDRSTGEPLAPVVVWSDLRGAARATELQGAGYMVMPQQAAAKLEGVVAGVNRANLAWGNVDSWIIWKLSGGEVHATDRSQAWTLGYLDLASLSWNEQLISHQNLDLASFPRLVDTWGVMGTTAREVLDAEVPIAADIADQQSALLGHGAEAPGAGKVTYGTSGTLNVSTGAELKFFSMTIPPFVLSAAGGQTQFCLEGMVITAGSAFDWLRRTFGIAGHDAFEQLAADNPDAAGAWFLPALQGLGAPHGDFTRKGALGGLTTATTTGHLVRAAVEGLACRVREAFDAVYEGAGLSRPDVLKVDGGMTNSDQLMQAQADILGLPVARHALREATAAGAAICAARGVGLLGSGETADFATYDRTFEPRPIGERFEQWKAAAYG
ncbi:MAG TPA: FGGY family carbohydrate kinase [Caulobacteraceae bacterium]